MGYSGLLLGPVAIGLIAGASSLHVGYAAVIVMCLLIAVGARFLPRGQHITASSAEPTASSRTDMQVDVDVTVAAAGVSAPEAEPVYAR
jgi:hypothetical protein